MSGRGDILGARGSQTSDVFLVTCTGYRSASVESGQNSEKVEEPRDDEEVKICCISGCLTTSAFAVLFFLAFPAGVLLCVYASNTSDDTLLAAGIAVSLLPLLGLPLLVVILFNRRKLQTLGIQLGRAGSSKS